MNDQGCQGTSTLCLLKLIGPTAVVSHTSIAETSRNRLIRLRREIRIVDQKHGNLAGQVDIAVVIPLALRGASAKTDKHQRRIFDRYFLCCAAGINGDISRLHQRYTCIPDIKSNALRFLDLGM